MEPFEISVVIPFYNAREYVTEAVESALAQPETGEILLVEDGSPDGGLEVCQALAEKYPKVKLLRHPDGINRGAAASRNLGIRNARFPIIAFLDADDYYLPGRFTTTAEVFQKQQQADGVYEAVGATYQNDQVKELFTSLSFKEITTVTKNVEPEALYEGLMIGNIGYFHLNGLTVRRTLLDEIGMFSDELSPYEDTDLMFKLSARGMLYPGSIQVPVAVRRVHDKNRITYHQADRRTAYKKTILLYENFIGWGRGNLTHHQMTLALHRCIQHLRLSDSFNDHKWMDFLQSRAAMVLLARYSPALLFDSFLWRLMIPSRQVFARNR